MRNKKVEKKKEKKERKKKNSPSFFPPANASKKDKRPHVVMVVLDDLGVKDLSYSTKLTRSLYKEVYFVVVFVFVV